MSTTIHCASVEDRETYLSCNTAKTSTMENDRVFGFILILGFAVVFPVALIRKSIL